MVNDVKQSLVGVNFLFDDAYDTRLYRAIYLVCSFLKTLRKTTLYKDECLMKVDTKAEPLKHRGYAIFDCLDNSK